MPAEVLLALGALCVFLAIALALVVIGVATRERRGVSRSLAVIRAMDAAPDVLRRELERPFAERVLVPLTRRLVGVGRRMTRADAGERLQHRLDIAGNPPGWDVDRILGVKVLAMGVLGFVGFVYMSVLGGPVLRTLVVTLLFAAAGFVLPNLLLFNAGQKREERMLKALPDALDLMTITVEAGLGFDAAVNRVARDTEGPLAQEFARLVQEMQLGLGRMAAMRAMAERTTIKDLQVFCLAMVQADAFGVPIARVLRVQAKEMRTRRRQRAEEKAQKVPVKILFPLVFFILPCLFIVVLGPVAMRMTNVL